jgi:hypothetical protein
LHERVSWYYEEDDDEVGESEESFDQHSSLFAPTDFSWFSKMSKTESEIEVSSNPNPMRTYSRTTIEL